jgi:hypothetical protein
MNTKLNAAQSFNKYVKTDGNLLQQTEKLCKQVTDNNEEGIEDSANPSQRLPSPCKQAFL